MKSLNISEVRNNLPVLIEGVAQTREPLMVMRYGTPMAMIVPVTPRKNGQTRYPLRGQPVVMAADFDAPMPELWHALAVAEPPDVYAAAKQRRSKQGAKS